MDELDDNLSKTKSKPKVKNAHEEAYRQVKLKKDEPIEID